jgi:hypothetical protein
VDAAKPVQPYDDPGYGALHGLHADEQARNFRIFRFVNRKASDIETFPADKSRDSGKHPELVVNQQIECDHFFLQMTYPQKFIRSDQIIPEKDSGFQEKNWNLKKRKTA